MITQRQKLVASKMVDYGGNMGKAMIAAGYSPATAKTPQKLTETSGWKELMEKNFNDEEVMRHHSFLINQFADLSVKAKAIDLYYKLRGKYSVNPAANENREAIEKISNELKDWIGAK